MLTVPLAISRRLTHLEAWEKFSGSNRKRSPHSKNRLTGVQQLSSPTD